MTLYGSGLIKNLAMDWLVDWSSSSSVSEFHIASGKLITPSGPFPSERLREPIPGGTGVISQWLRIDLVSVTILRLPR